MLQILFQNQIFCELVRELNGEYGLCAGASATAQASGHLQLPLDEVAAHQVSDQLFTGTLCLGFFFR